MVADVKTQYASLIERFGKGWEQGLADTIAECFTENGKFYPSPFESPAVGRAAIRTYWSDLPLEQAEVAFRFGEIFVAGPWFATEFKCTFRRRRTGQPVVIRGSLFCETDQERLSEMRMYWERRVPKTGS